MRKIVRTLALFGVALLAGSAEAQTKASTRAAPQAEGFRSASWIYNLLP
jgi:hypothetical protein